MATPASSASCESSTPGPSASLTAKTKTKGLLEILANASGERQREQLLGVPMCGVCTHESCGSRTVCGVCS